MAIAMWRLTNQGQSLPLEVGGGVALGLLTLVYSIMFHAKWGQSLGKMAVGIRVTTLDGQRIGCKHAVLRYSVDLILYLVFVVGALMMIWTWSGPSYETLSHADRHRLFTERNPTEHLYSALSSVWTWSEVIVLLFNEKRRALHDLIAGTVVIQIRGEQPNRKSVPLRHLAVDVPLFMMGVCLLVSCILSTGSWTGIIFRVLLGAFLMLPGILTFKIWRQPDTAGLKGRQ